MNGNFHVRFMLKDIFGFAEDQEKSTFGSGYKITLTRIIDEAVFDKAAGFADPRDKNDHLYWYVPHYIPSIQQQGFLSKEISNKTPSELR